MDIGMKVQILRACSSKKGNRCSSCPAFGHGDRSCIRNAMKDAATALSTLQAENEKLRAELERVKAERDAAIKDIWMPKWISCKNGENCDFLSAVTGMPDCVGCNNWEWRGPQKED